jgi:hypothetical protein
MQIISSLVFIVLLLLCTSNSNSKIIDNKNSVRSNSNSNTISISNKNSINSNNNNVISIRGGDVIKGKKTKSALKSMKEMIASVKPATRSYLFVILFCTIVHVLGLPAPALFNIDKSRIYELWRPITAMAYLGGPSMSMANNLYFLITYGQRLEGENGTGEHAWFLIVQTFLLTVFGGLILGFPFHGQAMVAAAVYVSSHIHPMEKMPFQFGFVITSWQLPFAMMVVDMLAQQNIAAAWPHILGIFTGHCYHFFTKVWPSLGGKAWLKPPKWIIKKLGDRPTSNIVGIDTRSKKEEEEIKIKKGKFGKKRNLTGKKLSQLKA